MNKYYLLDEVRLVATQLADLSVNGNQEIEREIKVLLYAAPHIYTDSQAGIWLTSARRILQQVTTCNSEQARR